MMISVIICSTNDGRLKRVTQNIAETIGVEYELLVRNNRGTGDGICKVYNELAEQACGEMLCFVHEDVQFVTQDWGQILSTKASEPKCGIIGFAGAAAKSRELSGTMHKKYGECSIIDCVENEPIPLDFQHINTSGLDFAPVVTVDGVCLFMSKAVWSEVKFDQTSFPGFHLYDLDMSTAVFVAGYTNYICHPVRLAHFSRGDYTTTWYQDSKIYDKKWDTHLPLYVNRPDDKQIAKDEKYIFFNITYHLIKRKALPPNLIRERIARMWREYPLQFKNYYLTYRFCRYALENKTKTK